MRENDNVKTNSQELKREEIKIDKIKGNTWWYRFKKRCFDFF